MVALAVAFTPIACQNNRSSGSRMDPSVSAESFRENRRTDAQPESPASMMPSQAQTSEAAGELASYRADGDVVFVNNHICAVSGSPLDPHTLGRFVSRVRYDGPIEKFRGKTLVFNQCCAMCIESFPKKWAMERDQIMRFHGLAR